MRYLAVSFRSRVVIVWGSPAEFAKDISLSCQENLRGRQLLLLNPEVAGEVSGFETRLYIA
jgi:hypothetical protein